MSKKLDQDIPERRTERSGQQDLDLQGNDVLPYGNK